MRTASSVAVAVVLGSLLVAGCGRDTTESVTADTLAPASSAAVDCAASMEQSFAQHPAIIFMNPGATEEQIASIRRMLGDDSSVSGVKFVSQDDAYAEFTSLFTDSPEMVDAVRPALLPSSFRLTLSVPAGPGAPTGPPSSNGDGLAKYRSASGVKQVIVGSSGSPCSKTDPAMLKAAQHIIDNRFGDNSMMVFIDPDSPTGVADMQALLLSMPTVQGIVFVSQDDALAEFKCMFKSDPSMVAGVKKEILPPSFRINVGTDPTVINDTATALKARPGVKTVVKRMTPEDLLAGNASSDGNGAPTQNPDCPVQGKRIK